MKYLLSDEELDDIGYPILPLGDRTGYKLIAYAAQKKLLEYLILGCAHNYHKYECEKCLQSVIDDFGIIEERIPC